MAEQVVIERRFRGPPESAQGGYSCGLVAERIEEPCAAVSLFLPPPLERPLEVRRTEDGAVTLLDGDRPVAEGRAADLRLDVPEPVSAQEASEASAESPWGDPHPFPGCFGCGPERTQAEAVAIVAGKVPGRDLFAGPWTPLAEFAGDGDVVASRFVWAALDCPTAAPAVPPGTPTSVLARLTARLIAPVRAERLHRVTAWLIGHDGRKHLAAAAIHDPEGRLCAYAEGLWIELRDPSAMGAKT